MLRASRLCQTTAQSACRRRTGLLVAKRMESTTKSTTAKSSGSIGKILVGLAFVSGAAYGGAVYYSLHNQEFRRMFITHIPGASDFVTFLEVALADNELGEVEEYWALAKDYGNKTVDAASNAYDYANDAYSKLTGVSDLSKLDATTTSNSDSLPSTIVSKLPGHKTTQDGTLTSDKASGTTTIVTTPVDQSPRIVVRRVASDHTVVNELSRVITELASILNDAGLANAGRDILTEAELQLQQLNARYQTLEKDQDDVLQRLQQLKQKVDGMEGGLDRLYHDTKVALDATHAATGDKLKHKESEIQEDAIQLREQYQHAFAKRLTAELESQQQRLEHERDQALVDQANELKRLFIRDTKTLIERERAGRLATLDTMAQRFESIESSSLQNAAALDHARQTHQLYVALSAVQDAVGNGSAHHNNNNNNNKQQSFVEEWEALRRGAEHDEGLTKIITSVSRGTVEQGIASVGELSSRFDVVADQVRRVALVPEHGGFGAHIVSFIMSKLLFKKYGLVEGDDVEAVLARSSYYLEKSDVENAARELNQLQGWPKKLAIGWIASARQHLEVKQALEIVESHVVLSSLADA
ncbi:mitochondrial inner membrane protein-domain-containing protein [Absidia repens]|uniref:MICOS complex subunit MIC60 n=1 Tax=Absidia repens TaxID=90262 RepID=A0A1X2IQ33_9FUNG|nr:mitochondrial inner membrane protein-domain-containing protein [Absidia repens]